MARPTHLDSPRSSRGRRSLRALPPVAPEVGLLGSEDEDQDSPPRRSSRGRDGGTRSRGRHAPKDREWETMEDDETLTQAPSHRYHSRPRGRQSTPPHSISSSRTSTRLPNPPISSMTRTTTIEPPYRRPSAREPASAGYEGQDFRQGVHRSQSRARSSYAAPSVHAARSSQRAYTSASVSASESNGDDTETTYDSREDGTEPRGNDRLRRPSRHGRSRSRSRLQSRSRSRTQPRRSHHRPRRRRRDSARHEEDYDEMDYRNTLSIDDEPPLRPHLRSRPQSLAPSARQNHDAAMSESESSSVHGDDRLRNRFERRNKSRHRHRSHKADTRRRRSESHMESSPTPKRSSSKRYYETEAMTADKLVRHNPPSAPLTRSNTVSTSRATAPQHHSVSSARRSSSSTFLGSFFGSSLHSHHHHATDKRAKIVECVVCMDDLPSRKTAKLKCGHRMCHSCLKRSFKLSITDPQHMPPKCCTAANIPLKHVERLFDIDFKRIWNKKFVEYSTRNRTYCPKKGCSEFIRPEDIRHADDGRKYGRCAKCRTKVCVRCNGRWHSGRNCPKDEDTVRFMAQAKDEGWQCCFSCKAMVELKEGCNHMTCLCGAEFCMICGARWKSCECPWFNYDTADNDRLEHVQIPGPIRDRFGGLPPVDMPPSPTRQARTASGPSAFTRPHSRPRQNYPEELHLRRLQEGRDETYARRLHNYQEFDGGPEDDFLGGFGDINGIGNAASHHMNDSFRPRPHNIVVPEPPLPSPLPAMTLDSAPAYERAATGDYIQGVNRARGVRAASLGRLADRFNADLRQNPMHRPPPLPTAATMPLPARALLAVPGAATTLPVRRPTVETGEVYADEGSRPALGGTRHAERMGSSGRAARPVFHEEPEDMLPYGVVIRKQHIRDPPKASNLAGLTGTGRGADRVLEWATHVQPGPDPDASSD